MINQAKRGHTFDKALLRAIPERATAEKLDCGLRLPVEHPSVPMLRYVHANSTDPIYHAVRAGGGISFRYRRRYAYRKAVQSKRCGTRFHLAAARPVGLLHRSRCHPAFSTSLLAVVFARQTSAHSLQPEDPNQWSARIAETKKPALGRFFLLCSLIGADGETRTLTPCGART